MIPIKIQFKINMLTENVFVEFFTQTRSAFSLFSLMAIWRVIYFRYYIIMTNVTQSVLVDVVFNTPTPCYYAD